MNSMERKRIEADIRALQFAQVEENIIPFASMKEHVCKACELRQNGDVQGKRRDNRKARLRLIQRVSLAVACLLIGIYVYSVLDPVPVSTANSFLRRAQIWAGNVLKLDVVVEPPEVKGVMPDAVPGDREDSAALKEAQETFGLTVLEPTQLPTGMTLGEIKTSGADDYLAKIQYSYQNQNDALYITIDEMADSGGVSIFVETIEYQTPVGTFYIWGNDTEWNALTISGNSYVNIRGTLNKDAFLNILDGLRAVN